MVSIDVSFVRSFVKIVKIEHKLDRSQREDEMAL